MAVVGVAALLVAAPGLGAPSPPSDYHGSARVLLPSQAASKQVGGDVTLSSPGSVNVAGYGHFFFAAPFNDTAGEWNESDIVKV